MGSIETMKTWPIIINADSEIPEYFREVFAEALEVTDAFPHTVLLPVSKKMHQMLSIVRNCIYIFEKTESVKTYIVNKSNFNYLETGKVLLNSWININLIDIPNTHLKIKYNTTCEAMFSPIIRKIRSFYINEGAMGLAAEEGAPLMNVETFESIRSQNYKLANYAEECIMPNEEVKSFLYQPVVLGKTLFPWSKIVLYPHLSILTDKEFIFIKDGSVKSKDMVRNPHGGIWYYIPLHRIVEIQMGAFEENRVEMEVFLKGNEVIEFVYESSLKEQVEAISVSAFRSLDESLL